MLSFTTGYKKHFILSNLILTFLFSGATPTFAHSPHDVIKALEISPVIEVTGAKNSKSTGSRLELDAFDVLP